MPKPVRVVTTSFYQREGFATVEENRALACDFVDAAGAEKADLVCLPETFLTANMSRESRNAVEPLIGPTFEALSKRAQRNSCWVSGTYNIRTDSGSIQNVALVIDRNGHLAGTYAKIHPTIRECQEDSVVPGNHSDIVETDFGRLGVAICYDIGWPDLWSDLAAKGAELLLWPSAYDGGFPLQVHAWTNFTPIVSSVLTEHSKIIGPTGRIVTQTSRWHRLATATIDLETEVFHIDNHREKLLQLQMEMGFRVTADASSEDHVFTLQSNDPEWPVSRIKDLYGLENYRDYHKRAEAIQAEHRHRLSPVHSDG